MSSLITSLVAPMIILTAMVFSFDFTKGEDVHELELFCNTKTNGDEENISDLVNLFQEETPFKGFFQRRTFQGYYWIATCNGVISEDECADCLDDAKNVLYKKCGFADGAWVKLFDCRLRFEHYRFS